MTTEYVLAYVPRKMKAEGFGNNYVLSFRELKLRSSESLIINASGQFYYLVGGFTSAVKIVSEAGVYDQLTDKINEMQHEHSGKIAITNREAEILHLQFIVITPQKNIKKHE